MIIKIKQLLLYVFVGVLVVSCDNDSSSTGPTIDDGLMTTGNNEDIAIIVVVFNKYS